MKTNLTWRYTEEENHPYNHRWKYIPEQYLRVRDKSRQAILGITHTVSPSFFYDLRVSYFSQSYYSGVDKDTSQYIPVGSYEYVSTAGNAHEFYSAAGSGIIDEKRHHDDRRQGRLHLAGGHLERDPCRF